MKKTRAIKYIGISGLILLLVILAFVLEHIGIIDLSCVTYKYTGLMCPGCGGTRMIQSLVQLEIYQAFRYNPLILISIPFYMYMYINCGISYIKHGRVTDKLANYMLVYVIIIMTYGIIRNISWLSILAPSKIN